MEKLQHQSCRDFLGQTGKLTTVCAVISLAGGIAQARPSTVLSGTSQVQTTLLTDRHYYLSDVLLEEGFEYDGDTVIGTRTALYTLEIKDGRIAAIHASGTLFNMNLPCYQVQGQLLLPAFRDMHIHLDKTFYGGPWQAPRPCQGKTIMDMITLEQTLIPKLLATSQQRAEGLIALLQSQGSTVARSHCNIDPVSGLKSLEHLQYALENHRNDFSCEIVAFPQHGLLNSKVEGLMREAMQMGVQYVGGLDPTNVDVAMEKSLNTMFQIALDNNAGVDIHLHESNPAGVAAINYMIDIVERTPNLRGKVTISHAFALTTLDEGALMETASRLAEQQITIASTVPIGSLMMPLPQLRAKGVLIMTGTDSVIDHWSPFGTGDMLEKANLYAQLYRGSDEYHLSRAMAIATGGVLPLNDQGQRAWPQVGDEAEFVLVAASCSAEAVARIPTRQATFHQGRLVAGTVVKGYPER
ncbi:N-isopropylammelide isopropyl amidohydrolase [Photorhabdus australis subsp. thailandensis]|uniref:N-isopropylammelide isopropyl amidohydrolase n=1 Tax=Photorhabdus australis subsp. thailandensis TaxID=2805096 RepID=A0A1C0UA34_9GAMM|nr:amidohydrolase family protein [Photorhabdus australis]OCQ54755.1 N-isopropylammelide isopropyl amidohydrolase [Photorhabdus australis subsp. thailandensis]